MRNAENSVLFFLVLAGRPELCRIGFADAVSHIRGMRTGTGISTDIGLLQAFRHERLSYVLLLCTCLILQGAVPSFAAVLSAQSGGALNFILCNGTTPVEDGNDTIGGSHPCLSGLCAMASGDPGVLQAAQAWNVDHTRRARYVGADKRITCALNILRVAIRGPPDTP